MKIFIPQIDFSNFNKSELFTGIRPFVKNNKIGNYPDQLEYWGIHLDIYVVDYKDCDYIIYPIVLSSAGSENKKFEDFEQFAIEHKDINVVVYIGGDYGYVYPNIANVIYYRMGGFNSQLDEKNKIFPFLLSDHLKSLLKFDTILIREKNLKPTIGFCGHASTNVIKYLYEKIKFLKINLMRIFILNLKLETLFSSAFERKRILNILLESDLITTNFIFRKKYRGGFIDDSSKLKTTLEYYQNLIDSDYVLCVRGGGNFSVRFYETLLMGRIPILIDTDCKLPFEAIIDWSQHIIRIPLNKINEIDSIVNGFHKNLNSEQFENLQIENRNLWLNFMNLNGFYNELNLL